MLLRAFGEIFIKFQYGFLFVSCVHPVLGIEDATGLSVNRFSRNDVVAFWHRYYMASEGYEERWGGSVNFTNCTLSAPPIEFIHDVQRRVNYYRAMTGLSGNVSFEDAEVSRQSRDAFSPPFGTTKADAARASALAFASQGFNINNPGAFVITHSLPSNFSCFNSAAWNGARNSNLAAGFWGPGAIDAYFDEPGSITDPLFNRFVGHRRWFLFSAPGRMATGDVPPAFNAIGVLTRPAVNVTYVIGGTSPREVQFVAWPNDGFTPEPLLSKLWSLGYPGADFSAATISMTDASGGAVPLQIVAHSVGASQVGEVAPEGEQGGSLNGIETTGPGEGSYGDSAIIWQPQIPTEFTADTTYTVTVSNIRGAGPASHTYSVTIIDPTILEGLELIGSSNPPVTGANYYYGPVIAVDGFDFEVSQLTEMNEVEDAEGSPVIIDQSTDGVDLTGAHSFPASFPSKPDFFLGSQSFRLAFADANDTPHGFEIDRDLSTQTASQLIYKYRRGLMTNTTRMDVEFSTDGGITWTSTGSRVSGVDGLIDSDFTTNAVSLPIAESLRIRFRQTNAARTSFFNVQQGAAFAIGIFIDDISFANTQAATNQIVQNLDASALQGEFTTAALGGALQAGQAYHLRVRPRVSDFAFAWSPIKQVTVQESAAPTGFAYWSEFTYPTVSGFHDDFDQDGLVDGLEYALGTNPIDGSDGMNALKFTREGRNLCLSAPAAAMASDVNYRAEWSVDLKTWRTERVGIQIIEGQLKATASVGGIPNVQMRWVVSPK